MTNDQLKSSLHQLHTHLATTASVDPELRSLLQTLDQDIHQLLQAAPSAPDASDAPEAGSLSERAQALSAKFAAQHPQLEIVLRQLANTLENIGI